MILRLRGQTQAQHASGVTWRLRLLMGQLDLISQLTTSRLKKGMPPLQLTPGGDFGYLKKNYTWKDSGTSGVSSGERHGHNIIALDYGYVADTQNSLAPGGKYPSASLSCISCHNKHGIISTVTTTNYSGTYRMLGGIGYTQKNVQGAAPFKAAAPIAVSPSEYNRSEATADTRIAYGKGMSEWCMNCHPEVIGHPAGSYVKLSTDIVSNYNSYIKTGNMSGSKKTSYSSLTPFEEGTDSITTLVSHASSSGEYTQGPDGNANVMCLTCHRAHASGFDNVFRWNGNGKFLVINGEYPTTDQSPETAQGRTPAELQQAYYGRPSSYFGTMQTGYCNKCHPKE